MIRLSTRVEGNDDDSMGSAVVQTGHFESEGIELGEFEELAEIEEIERELAR